MMEQLPMAALAPSIRNVLRFNLSGQNALPFAVVKLLASLKDTRRHRGHKGEQDDGG
jgi:hypothetical protein